MWAVLILTSVLALATKVDGYRIRDYNASTR